MAEPSGGHLGASRVVHAQEQHGRAGSTGHGLTDRASPMLLEYGPNPV